MAENRRKQQKSMSLSLTSETAVSLDTLHNTLNGALAEIVTVALHGQTVNTDRYFEDCPSDRFKTMDNAAEGCGNKLYFNKPWFTGQDRYGREKSV